MKKIRIIAVGSIKEKYLIQAIDEYLKRLKKFCKIEIIEIQENDDIKKFGTIDFLFDIKGELITSENLSSILDKQYIYADTVTFLIGGSHGFSEETKKSAKNRISFGLVTYPHQLFRVLVLEQIYRSFSIVQGLPYHK
ncbi:MAG: 23S rRNA (pseudouridine(1915)-N(3))-methyltransferase RlmH [Firmicutes bacterium]|nr:23S rRNA (pseudouridine(1915)-N(3))-methyltransferase RlmH [Bacillota bacterium]